MQGYITPQVTTPTGVVFNVLETPLFETLFSNLFPLEFSNNVIPRISLLPLITPTYQNTPINPEDGTRQNRFESMRYTVISGNTGTETVNNMTLGNSRYKRIVSGLSYQAQRVLKVFSSFDQAKLNYPLDEFVDLSQVNRAPEVFFYKLKNIAGQLAKDIDNAIASALFFNQLSNAQPPYNTGLMPFVRYPVCLPITTSFMRYQRKYQNQTTPDNPFNLFLGQAASLGGFYGQNGTANSMPTGYFETLEGATSDIFEDIKQYMNAQDIEDYTVVMGTNVARKIRLSNYPDDSRRMSFAPVIETPILDENPNCLMTVPSGTSTNNIASLGVPFGIKSVSISNDTVPNPTDPSNPIPLLNVELMYIGGTPGTEKILPNGIGSTIISNNGSTSINYYSIYFHPAVPIATNIPLNNNNGRGENALSQQDCNDTNRIVLYVNAPSMFNVTANGASLNVQVSMDQLALVGNGYGLEPTVATNIADYSYLSNYLCRTATTPKLDWMIYNSTNKKTPMYLNMQNLKFTPVFALGKDAFDGIFQTKPPMQYNKKANNIVKNWMKKAYSGRKLEGVKYLKSLSEWATPENSNVSNLLDVQNIISNENLTIDPNGANPQVNVSNPLVEMVNPPEATRIVSIAALLDGSGNAAGDIVQPLNIVMSTNFTLNIYPRRACVMFLMSLPATFTGVGTSTFVGSACMSAEMHHRLQFESIDSLVANNQYSSQNVVQYLGSYLLDNVDKKDKEKLKEISSRYEDFKSKEKDLLAASKMLSILNRVDPHGDFTINDFIKFCKDRKISSQVAKFMINLGYYFVDKNKEDYLSAKLEF